MLRAIIVAMALAGASARGYVHPTLTYFLPDFGGTADGSTVVKVPKWPIPIPLLAVYIVMDAQASYEYSATNPDISPESVEASLFSGAQVQVTDPRTGAVLAQAGADVSEDTFTPVLDQGESISNSNSDDTGIVIARYDHLNPLFKSFFPTTSSPFLAVSESYSNHSSFISTGDLDPLNVTSSAGIHGYIQYVYGELDPPQQTPSPAAALTMLAGVFSVAARRARARKGL